MHKIKTAFRYLHSFHICIFSIMHSMFAISNSIKYKLFDTQLSTKYFLREIKLSNNCIKVSLEIVANKMIPPHTSTIIHF